MQKPSIHRRPSGDVGSADTLAVRLDQLGRSTVVDASDDVLHHDVGVMVEVTLQDLADDAGEAWDQFPVLGPGAEPLQVSEGRGGHADDVPDLEVGVGMCHASWSP